MDTESIYEEITPEESILLSIEVLIGLTAIIAVITYLITFEFSNTFFGVVITGAILSLIWVVSGYFKRKEIKGNELGAMKIFGRPIRPYVFTPGSPWILPGVISFETRAVGENVLKVEVTEISKPEIKKGSAPVQMKMTLQLRYVIYDIFTEISIESGSGLKSLEALVDASAREIIVGKTDFELMNMRSSTEKDKKNNIITSIFEVLKRLDPQHDQDPKKETVHIEPWGIMLPKEPLLIKEIKPADPKVIEAYESVRKAQLQAQAEEFQTENLRENAKRIKNEFKDEITYKEALEIAQIEDKNPGVVKIILSGAEDTGDFTKAQIIKHYLEEMKGKKKKD